MANNIALVFTVLDVLMKLAQKYPEYKAVWDSIRKKEGVTDEEWAKVKTIIETHSPDFTHPDEIEPAEI